MAIFTGTHMYNIHLIKWKSITFTVTNPDYPSLYFEWKNNIPSELSFLILCRNGARCDMDHGEVGRAGNITGVLSPSSGLDWPCSGPSGVCLGNVRPARRDFNNGRSGYRLEIFLQSKHNRSIWQILSLKYYKPTCFCELFPWLLWNKIINIYCQ